MDREHDDRALIERARAGDRAAFAALWTAHSEAARRLAGSITQTFDADDLVSEAYLKIFTALQAGKGPTGPFRPYLFVTIRNLAVSWSRRKRDDSIEEAESFPDPRATDTAILVALDEQLTMRAFRSLPERWQQVLWFTEVDGLQPQEIADRLQLKPNSVAALAYRAREGLRQAWIQAHIDSAAAGSDHRWALEHIGQAVRSSLSPRNRAKYDAHLAGCANCTVIAAEAQDTSARFTSALLPIAVGITGTAGLGEFLAHARTPTDATPNAEHGASAWREHVAVRTARTVVATRRRRAVLAGAALIVAAGITASAVYGTTQTAPTPVEAAAGLVATATPTASELPTPTTAATPKPRSSELASKPSPREPDRPERSAPGRVSTEPRTDSGSTTSAADPQQAGPPSAGPAATQPVVSITNVDTGRGAFYPLVSGTAAPGSVVTVSSRAGATASATADTTGVWAAPQLTAFPTGTGQITASSAGAVSGQASARVTRPAVSTASSGDTLTVQIRGVPSTGYALTWDGAAFGSARTDSSGAASFAGQVNTTGTHTLSVAASDGARSGPATTMSVRF
ncbi:sigma-70 family RNA polymerase sigma factor [Curtobacterium sp. L1-20]|uniref:sigma-70 family RNA polymerase sigma factor n=1 Tax=Curtobacterium sp. L1-20 TaxID=3138181 RepID=UPI003B51F16C